MKRLSKEQVLLLHSQLIESFGGREGVRDNDLLDSALEIPFQTFDGDELYPTKEEKAARIGYSLISNHAFVDGNKRIGALVLLTLLELNGYPMKVTNAEFADIIMGVAASEKDEKDLLEWVEFHS